ncbi:Hypothetical protein ORPV_640 [Orpheovirus IHUMI-LCC2]|uniref:Uncharacterized protein n=1 Tax=Orpheovirus IHUMI-LCC2 TaxID=2023057 RepID=A0A2I2L4T7_9VIRU|nr:Hypothetical protein ORPV_640 [Orpheovirus IHUMI-LCC2]SNW62544.1 Hypothetical protein ORPV_640 [Orpheovirus IHUMI-LCC2]
MELIQIKELWYTIFGFTCPRFITSCSYINKYFHNIIKEYDWKLWLSKYYFPNCNKLNYIGDDEYTDIFYTIHPNDEYMDSLLYKVVKIIRNNSEHRGDVVNILGKYFFSLQSCKSLSFKCITKDFIEKGISVGLIDRDYLFSHNHPLLSILGKYTLNDNPVLRNPLSHYIMNDGDIFQIDDKLLNYPLLMLLYSNPEMFYNKFKHKINNIYFYIGTIVDNRFLYGVFNIYKHKENFMYYFTCGYILRKDINMNNIRFLLNKLLDETGYVFKHLWIFLQYKYTNLIDENALYMLLNYTIDYYSSEIIFSTYNNITSKFPSFDKSKFFDDNNAGSGVRSFNRIKNKILLSIMIEDIDICRKLMNDLEKMIN